MLYMTSLIQTTINAVIGVTIINMPKNNQSQKILPSLGAGGRKQIKKERAELIKTPHRIPTNTARPMSKPGLGLSG